MRQRFGIILTVLLALGVLVAINSVAYVSEDEQQDSELSPDRSSYNAGATGTRALFDLLNETGYKVIRWREAPDKLLGINGQKVQTFVIVGRTPVFIDEDEAKSLLAWVERGGRLVIIDRRPAEHLLPRSGEWAFTTELLAYPGFGVDPDKPEQLTAGVKPVKPAQPTRLTRDVETVMPSRYFAVIKFFIANKAATKNSGEHSLPSDEDGAEPTPTTDAEPNDGDTATPVQPGSPAPVVHLTTSNGALLVDYPHGKGNIAVLSDPFMVANEGIALADNLQLALNLLSNSDGQIAFDEFHHGHGVTGNAFASYFAGTPILALGGQIALLIILMLWTRGRRFARPLPLPRVDRRSSLEFVASMAELQQRAHAFDLAIENIYSRTRRVLARYAGVDYNSSRSEIASRVAARSTLDAHALETLMRQSEEAINGATISERQSIHLVKRLREVEANLGLRMRSRDVKQTAQNI
jgi:Holliday junction resolvase